MGGRPAGGPVRDDGPATGRRADDIAAPAARRVGGLVLSAWALAWGTGIVLQLQQAALSADGLYAGLLAAAAALGLVAWRWVACPPPLRGLGASCLALALAAAGFGLTGLQASARLADRLDPALEGADLVLTGVVASLPQRLPTGLRFDLVVESAWLDGRPVRVPARVSLGWFRGWERAGAGATLLAGPQEVLRAGERWRLPVRLRQPHGLRNPHGFDAELSWFEQGLRATGQVRPTPAVPAQRLDAVAGHPVERARQAVRDAIDARLPDPRTAGVVAALAIGDQDAIQRADWEIFRESGVAHLMSISGLHVTMFSWLAAAAIGALWRRHPRWPLHLATPVAARWGGLAAATLYAVFSGFGVPAQRTVWMLATAVVLVSLGRRWPWPLILLAAGVVVTVLDPWALLQPGFWLSFAAVGLLLASQPVHGGRDDPALQAALAAEPTAPALPTAGRQVLVATRGLLRTQWTATLGLTPLTLLLFQQVSLIGAVANLVAIPLVSLVVTPLALGGIVLPPLWTMAGAIVDGLTRALAAFASLPGAVWTVPAAPWWAQLAGLAAGALAILPLPARVRLMSVPLALPMLWPAVAVPPPGHFDLLAADVGQGTAVLVRTHRHQLLYDAGPSYGPERDAGERVLVPLLRALGVSRLDRLVLSHGDLDHIGGAASLRRVVPVGVLSSSLPPGHPLLEDVARERCDAGQRWQWDGVSFEFLHPRPQDHAAGGPPNGLSCVLRIEGGGRSALLTGDIERLQELALTEREGERLRSDVLLVPHHGSRTSSTAALLEAVQPSVAVVQAGHRNRFGHPASEVVARYRSRGIVLRASPACGAWHWPAPVAGLAAGAVAGRCERDTGRRYWHHPGPHGASTVGG